MSSVPFTFANQTGNIALSELDANFANVKANVDNAVTAQTVSSSSQPNVTSVGTMINLSVFGNISSNGVFSTSGNISSDQDILANGNVNGGNLTTTGNVHTDNIFVPAGSFSVISNSGMMLCANGYPTLFAYGSDSHGGPEFDWSNSDNYSGDFFSSSNYRNSMYINGQGLYVGINENSCAGLAQGSLTFNENANLAIIGNAAISGNLITGNITAAYSFHSTGLEIASVNYVDVTANATTTSLSTTVTRNILIANNTGYTHTVNMPTSPVDGQLTKFAVSGNTMTLVKGTGNVTPTFAGSTTAGSAYTYVYRDSNTTWYRIS